MKLQLDFLQPNQTIVIGYSGGPDSTYLLHALKQIQDEYQLTLIAAHLDHQWRPNSADDVVFCREQAQTLNIPFVSARADELNVSIKPNGSKEETGRKLRRAFFARVANEYKADLIALGHHADDQLETFFIRLMRGATLSGLVGIRTKQNFNATNVVLIRPLLGMRKQEIVDCLDMHKIPYLIDYTNDSADYLRNRIRLRVVPALEEADARFAPNFFRSLEHLQQAEELLTHITAQTIQACMVPGSNDLQKDKLLAQPPYLIKRVLLTWMIQHQLPFTPSDGLLEEMLRFITNPSENKQHPLHEQWMLCKKGNVLMIKRREVISYRPDHLSHQ